MCFYVIVHKMLNCRIVFRCCYSILSLLLCIREFLKLYKLSQFVLTSNKKLMRSINMLFTRKKIIKKNNLLMRQTSLTLAVYNRDK